MADRTEHTQSQSGSDRDNNSSDSSQDDTNTDTDPAATDHPTGEAQAAANADNESAG